MLNTIYVQTDATIWQRANSVWSVWGGNALPESEHSRRKTIFKIFKIIFSSATVQKRRILWCSKGDVVQHFSKKVFGDVFFCKWRAISESTTKSITKTYRVSCLPFEWKFLLRLSNDFPVMQRQTIKGGIFKRNVFFSLEFNNKPHKSLYIVPKWEKDKKKWTRKKMRLYNFVFLLKSLFVGHTPNLCIRLNMHTEVKPKNLCLMF